MIGVNGRMTIFVEDLEVQAWIGAHHHERGQTQLLILSVELGIVPPERDVMEDTVDYQNVVEAASQVFGKRHIETVEYAAREIADCLFADPRVLDVVVRIRKPAAIPSARFAGAAWSACRG